MLSHLKRQLGVISAVAVVAAGITVLSASPAAAVPATAAAPAVVAGGAVYSACPAGSASAAGFTDTTSTDVDCIKMHGITTGVTATTYEPTASVPRYQMALYLTRMATSAGHTLGTGADQGFTDISGYTAAIQTAINQLKQLGVTTGTTATTYSPGDNVTREQMAMFIERLLAKTAVGPGGENDTVSLLTLYVNDTALTYNYDDIDTGSVTYEGHNAIAEIYQLGITGDSVLGTNRTFNPSADITRATMATWVTNALAHTNARPAGVSIQTAKASGYANNTPNVSVTYRDSARNPVQGTIIDVFHWVNSTTLGNTSPFSATTGKCHGATGTPTAVSNSLTACTLDAGDMATNSSGNLALFASTSVTDATTATVYAWTAAAGTAFVEATHLADAASVDISSSAAATKLMISANLPAAADTAAHVTKALFGTSVTVTVQATVPHPTLSNQRVNVPEAGIGIAFTEQVKTASGGTVLSQSTTVALTDATGAASYTFTQADPAPATSGSERYVTVTVGNNTTAATVAAAPTTITRHQQSATIIALGLGELDTIANTTVGDANAAASIIVDFLDATKVVSRATVSQNSTKYLAGSALAPVARSATATLTDQYGAAITGNTGTWTAGLNKPLHASTGCQNTNDLIEVAAAAHGFANGDPFTFLQAHAGVVNYVDNTTYYAKWATATEFAGYTEAALTNIVVLTGDSDCDTGTTLVAVNAFIGAVDRVVSANGVASIAWSDTTSTGGVPNMCFLDEDLNDTFTAGCKSATRYTAPTASALPGGTGTGLSFTHATGGASAADEHVLLHSLDLANKTMILSIEDNGVQSATVNETVLYNTYTWDSNDYFYIAGAQTTMALFEGKLSEHNIDKPVSAIITVSYAPIAGNISTWNALN
jgi:hypothetical protein